MEPALWDALRRFARGDYSVFEPELGEDGGVGHEQMDPEDPLTFARFCVYLAVHRLNFPVETYDHAFTDGRGEKGLDGIVVSLGGEPLPRPEVIEQAVEELLVARELTGSKNGIDPTAVPQPKVLFVQAKRELVTPMREVDYFGACAERFIAYDERKFQALRPNEDVLRWWRVYDGVRRVYQRQHLPFRPSVDLVFGYAGRWTAPVGPEASRVMAEEHLKRIESVAEVRYQMWGTDELVQAVEWTSKAVSGELKSPSLIPLPNGGAEAYIGYVPAASLVDLIPDVGGRPDERVFLDNVRSFLGEEEVKGISPNPGAVGLKHSLAKGEGAEVVLRHNGVTIVTRGIERMANGNLWLREFQIVNGAQTTNVLFRNRKLLEGCEVHIPLKVVVTENEEVKNGVIVGANTQAPVGHYDMLARVKEVRLLHRAFDAIAFGRPEKIWLQRRRREWIPASGYRDLRYVTPRQLLEGFASAFMRLPHRVQNEPRKFLDYVPGRIFCADHDPSLYLATGWMVVTGRRWVQQHEEGRWGGASEREAGGYPGRYQYLYALRLLVDSEPDQSDAEFKRGSKPVMQRFERICAILAGPEGPRFGDAAALAVAEVSGEKRLTGTLTRKREFTEMVYEAAMRRRDALAPYREAEPAGARLAR